MNNFFRALAALFLFCFALQADATDIIYGGCHYKEWNGRYAGFQKRETYATFLSNDEVSLVYCLRMPKADVSGVARITPMTTGEITLQVNLSDCETGVVLLDHEVTVEAVRNQDMTIEIMPTMALPQDTWYRLELKAPQGYSRISKLHTLEFERTGSNPVCDAHLRGFPTPATHLWFGHSTAKGAPQDESYEWCYQEVCMPEQWATINTYLMTLGITGGYMGIQMAGKTVKNEEGAYTDTIPSSWTHQALFSIWDNGDTDLTPDLASYLRAGALTWGEGVVINHFGNEGTGCQSMITNAKWNPGQWVQFLTLARPEEIDVTLTDDDGNPQTIKYPCSLLSAWYKTTDDPEWHYISTIRHSGESHYWNSWYSFVENWADSGGELFRRAYYRNNYQRSVGSGKWYFVNKASFSQTTYQDFINSGEITARQRRMDYGHGLASDVDRAFFMQCGGYGQPKDSANVLPLVDDHTVVDTIDLEALKLTVRAAIIKDGNESVTNAIKAGATAEDRLAIVGRYIEKTNRFGGYAQADMQEVIDLWNDPATRSKCRQKLIDISKTAYPLKYGNTLKMSHISSYKTYQLRGANGVLVVSGGQLSAQAADDCDVTAPENNWLVLRHDTESYYCAYNLGTGLYLGHDGSKFCLSDQPQKLNITRPNSGDGFLVKSGTKAIGINANLGITSSTRVTESNYLSFLDNYYLTPDPALCSQLLEESTSDAIAAGIEAITVSPDVEDDGQASLAADIVNVRYYNTDGTRAGYDLQPGHTYVAYILLRNGATMVRKIAVK